MKYISRLQYITQKTTQEEIELEVKNYLSGGGDWVQLRMKGATDDEYLATALKIKELCYAYNATFIINDNVAIAIRCMADGVHLGNGDMPTSEARRLMGRKPIIGRTANTARNIEILSNQYVDYIGLGPYKWTSTKENLSPVLGIDGYDDILGELEEYNINFPPIVAIGSVGLEDIPLLMDLEGIHGIAVSGSIANAENPRKTTMEFVEKMDIYNVR